jgi:hypothetical protein
MPHPRPGESQFCADHEDRGNAQPALVFEKSVVHIPEHSGCAGELGTFGGDLGVRVHFGQREMTKSEPHASAKGQFNGIMAQTQPG